MLLKPPLYEVCTVMGSAGGLFGGAFKEPWAQSWLDDVFFVLFGLRLVADGSLNLLGPPELSKLVLRSLRSSLAS